MIFSFTTNALAFEGPQILEGSFRGFIQEN